MAAERAFEGIMEPSSSTDHQHEGTVEGLTGKALTMHHTHPAHRPSVHCVGPWLIPHIDLSTTLGAASEQPQAQSRQPQPATPASAAASTTTAAMPTQSAPPPATAAAAAVPVESRQQQLVRTLVWRGVVPTPMSID